MFHPARFRVVFALAGLGLAGCTQTWTDAHGSPHDFVASHLSKDALLPRTGRNESGIFIRQIDTGLSSQSHHGGVLSNAVDSELFAYVIEEDITRFHDRGVHIERTVAVFIVAVKCVTVEGRVAWTENTL